MKRICIIRHNYYPQDPRVQKEAEALINEGYEVDVVCLKDIGEKSRDNLRQVNIYRLPLRHRVGGIMRHIIEYATAFILFASAVSFLHFKKRYVVIQVHTMPDFLVFVTLIPKLCGAKVLLDLHEPTPELWVTKYGNSFPLLFILQKKIQLLAIRYADWSLTVTETLRCHFGKRGADIETMTVVTNVCDESVFDTIPTGKHRKPDGSFRLVSHGTIEERYGHDTIIRAIDALRDTLPGLQLEIIGYGAYTAALVNLVDDLNCGDRVKFPGFLPYEDLLKTIVAADVGVIALKLSPYSVLIETNKMYEYIALQKPVIASRLPAVQESFDDSCLMFFEPGNHLDLARCVAELYRSANKRNKLVRNASRRYDKMRWSKTKKIYVDVIEGLTG